MTHHQAALGAGDEIQFFTNYKADQRFCTQPNCKHDGDNLSYIEDEQHFIIQCHQYDDLRTDLYSKISIPGFSFFSDYDKFNLFNEM